MCVFGSTLDTAHNYGKSTIKDPTVGGKGMHRNRSHFGLWTFKVPTGVPSNILTGFLRILGGDGSGLTPLEGWTGRGSAQ